MEVIKSKSIRSQSQLEVLRQAREKARISNIERGNKTKEKKEMEDIIYQIGQKEDLYSLENISSVYKNISYIDHINKLQEEINNINSNINNIIDILTNKETILNDEYINNTLKKQIEEKLNKNDVMKAVSKYQKNRFLDNV